MTDQQAVQVVQKIVLENQENGELEGILNRHRVAALNHLLRIVKHADQTALNRGWHLRGSE
jgi:hypothetical protein